MWLEPLAYRRLSWWQQRRIDWRLHRRSLLSRFGIGLLLVAVAIELTAFNLIWNFDLTGWPGAVPRMLAPLYVGTALEFERRRHLFVMYRA